MNGIFKVCRVFGYFFFFVKLFCILLLLFFVFFFLHFRALTKMNNSFFLNAYYHGIYLYFNNYLIFKNIRQIIFSFMYCIKTWWILITCPRSTRDSAVDCPAPDIAHVVRKKTDQIFDRLQHALLWTDVYLYMYKSALQVYLRRHFL